MPNVKVYTVDKDGDWMPLTNEKKQKRILFRVEYAKSGRASCHLCKERIKFKEIRIGTPVKFRGGGPHGFITSWKHLTCERVTSEWRKVKDLGSYISGFDGLTKKERKMVLKEIKSTKKSEMLTPIAADDPKFWKSTEPRKKREAPPTFVGKLLPFQEEGLNWMMEREDSKHGGGILADEMGMGKTIQTICLLLATLNRKPKLPTLIVCPSSALLQWASEIGHFTMDNVLNVLVYYGNRAKSLTIPELMRFDVIMTSYNVIEWEYRKCLNKYKKKCPYCSKLYLPRALISHTIYFCGPNARRSAKLKLRDKKKEKATKKAMKTLRIIKDTDDDDEVPISKPKKKKFRPTPMGVYLELMAEAGRDSISWCGRLKTVDEEQVLKDDVMSKAPGGGMEKGSTGTNDKDPPMGAYSSIPQNTKKFLNCPSGHLLKQFKTWSKMFECDLCAETQRKGYTMWGCRRCDYDICMNCRRRAGERVVAKAEGILDEPRSIASEQRKRRWICQCGALTLGNYQTCHQCESPAPKRRKFEWVCKACVVRNPPGVASAKCTKCGIAKSKTKSKLLKYTPKSATPEAKTPGTPKKPSTSKEKTPGRPKKKQVQLDPWEEEDKPTVIDLSESRLHMVPWGRIILDEAHKIKGRTTSTAMSVYALNSKKAKRWCLSGTPFQNRIGELYSLVKFLELDPYAFYFCKMKGCTCKSVNWSFGPMSRRCDDCKHSPLKHYSYFNKHIINPVKRSGYVGEGKKAIYTLKAVLDEVQLRRTKKERAEDVKLPPLTVRLHNINLNEKEKDFYESIYKRCRTKFDAYVNKGTFLHNYAHIFDLLSRLRQTTDHPFLVVFSRPSEKALKWASKKSKTGGSKEKVTTEQLALKELPSKSRGGADVCYICQDQVQLPNIIVTGCKHVFHRTCMMTYLSNSPISELSKTKKKKKKAKKEGKNSDLTDGLQEVEDDGGDGVLRDKTGCPVCFLPITVDLKTPINPRDYARLLLRAKKAMKKKGTGLSFGRGSILNKINLKNFESSTKVEELTRLVLEACNKRFKNKCIIFSQYTNMLDIIDWRLHKAGIKTVKLVGSMPINMRKSVLLAFKHDPNVRVILLSLRAGGEGLNLQSATHVFLMEPWWNPAVEYQAIQRAHRIGQTHEVIATRFITHGTIEQRMLELQEKKRLIFDGCIDQNAGSFSRLDAEDLKFLFRP